MASSANATIIVQSLFTEPDGLVPSPLDNSKSSLSSLLAFCPEDPSITRPVKRRRLHEQLDFTSHELQPLRDIPLAEISLKIEFDEQTVPPLNNQERSWSEIPIVIGPCEINNDNSLNRLYLSRGSSYNHGPRVALRGHLIDQNGSLIEDLKNLSSIPSTRLSTSKSLDQHPVWGHCRLANNFDGSYCLSATIYTNTEGSSWDTSPRNVPTRYSRVIHAYLPTKRQADSQSLPRSFYDVVHTTDRRANPPETIEYPLLQSKLYPFQKRAVAWLLSREGVEIRKDGTLNAAVYERAPYSFEKLRDCHGHIFYVSRLLQQFSRKEEDIRYLHQQLRGGVLAEEMGLGKTVELIDLICLHRQTEGVKSKLYDQYTGKNVTSIASTLIITPPSILEQWMTELEDHAPHLKVMHYKGVKHSDREIEQQLQEQDVVVTTYSVLSSEIHYAVKSDRSLRYQKKYAHRQSALMKFSWWRVCLDEAQMVENGVSNAAIVARTIPRRNAWAVSGTPVRKNTQDLLGLLVFLRFEPFCDSAVWNRLCTPNEENKIFGEIFGEIALRHNKSQIRDELALPNQKRVVITVPFTAVEEQHYKEMFGQMCEDVGLNLFGGPLRDDWDPDSDKVVSGMKRWLTRLRQTCLHPELGERNRRALGRREGPLRTVDEVLQVMVDQNETALRQEERLWISAKLMQGHIFSCTKGVDKAKALDHYLVAFKVATAAVNECREQVEEDLKEQGSSAAKVDNSETNVKNSDAHHSDRENLLRNRLRSALEMQHSSAFFVASGYYQVKMQKADGNEESDLFKEFETQEAQYYDIAKKARQEILVEASTKATKTLKKLAKAREAGLQSLPHFEYSAEYVGIESRKIIEQLVAIEKLMNSQAKELQGWRQKLVELLSASLLDQDDVDLTGEEYEETIKNQDEQYAYLFVLNTGIAIRTELLNGQLNALVFHETKTTLRDAIEGNGHAPELTKACLETLKHLYPARDKAIPTPRNLQSLRKLISDVRSMLASVRSSEDARMSNRAAAEAEILESILFDLQKMFDEHTKALSSFEKEYELYRNAMNARLEYYRQLQIISDTVKPYSEDEREKLDEKELNNQKLQEVKRKEKVNSLFAKRKFLETLKAQKTGEQEQHPCIICLQPFENGVLTVCAHEFCKECISIWLSQHHCCPTCKTHLRRYDYRNITYKPRKLRAQEEQVASSSNLSEDPGSAHQMGIYSSVTNETLNEIKSINLSISWSSKIDSIVRHLLYLRATDPGSKFIVFSQYREFLAVLGDALAMCKMRSSSMTEANGIEHFKRDASVECFLLHAKADSSGLNLVIATHVVLCEPLVNTALELQAIARVHRIGQRRPTTVWMYLVSGTVEEAIYDLSVERRLKLINQKSVTTSSPTDQTGIATPADDELKLDMANSLQLQAAPLKRLVASKAADGEMVEKNDLWQCLFGRPKARSAELETKDENT